MVAPRQARAFDDLSAAEIDALREERERDRFRDACGVFGIQGHDEASNIVYLGLYALQHRGQESCGIVASNGREHTAHRAMGLVADTFNEKTLARIKGRHAIGHVRYSTAGESHLRNAQPICANTDGGPVSIATPWPGSTSPHRRRSAPYPPGSRSTVPRPYCKTRGLPCWFTPTSPC